MPRYTYQCDKCEEVFNVFHSIKEKKEHCDCGAEGSLKRLPSMPLVIQSSDNSAAQKVHNHIKSAKEELERDREERKKEEKW